MDARLYRRSLKRIMHELEHAICQDRAFAAIWNCHSNHGLNFFRIAFYALSNDSVAHAMKVLDRHPQCVGFWMVFNQKEKEIRNFCRQNGVDFGKVEKIADSLKIIRDRTHFHIDGRDVFNPDDVWKRANIMGSDFTEVLDSLWKIVGVLYEEEYGETFPELEYDGSDIEPILRIVAKSGIVSISFDEDPAATSV